MFNHFVTDLSRALVMIFPQTDVWTWESRVTEILSALDAKHELAKYALQTARKLEAEALHLLVQSVKNQRVLREKEDYERAARVSQERRITVANISLADENIHALPDLLVASLDHASRHCLIPSFADDVHNVPRGGDADRLFMEFCHALDLKAEIQAEGIAHPHIVISW